MVDMDKLMLEYTQFAARSPKYKTAFIEEIVLNFPSGWSIKKRSVGDLSYYVCCCEACTKQGFHSCTICQDSTNIPEDVYTTYKMLLP